MTKVLHHTKQIVPLFTFLALVSIGLINPTAHADELDDFVTGMIKVATNENYKLRASINGEFNFEDDTETMEGSYQIVMNSQVDNRCGLGCKEADQVNLKITLIPMELEGLQSIIVTANLNILSYNQGKELYLKLNDLNLQLGGTDPEIASMQASMDMMLEPVKQKLKNQWVSLSEEDMQKLYDEEGDALNALDTDALATEFLAIVENAEGKTGREILNSILQTTLAALETQGEVTSEESQILMSMATTAMNTKLFRHFDVVSGNNVGFKHSILNRFALAEMTEKMMQEVEGTALTDSEKQDMRTILNKMGFSGWYHFTPTGMIDALTVYFEVNDLEALKHFHLKFHQTLHGEGEAVVPTAPTEVVDLEEIEALFMEMQ